jgi:hypothetical protein
MGLPGNRMVSLLINNYLACVLTCSLLQLNIICLFLDQHSKAAQNLSKAATSKANVSSCLGGPETDATTSTENLSMEERYYIKHNARQEPQGQEKQEVKFIRFLK